MRYASLAAAAILLMATTRANAASIAPQEQEDAPYKPATRDYGKVNKVWEYKGPLDIEVPPGKKIVAADLELPATTEAFDLDDIDIVDADSGESFGSDELAQRLTATGEPIDDRDPDVDPKGPYRGIFTWVVDARVRRVNFGYWGDLLFRSPVALSPGMGAPTLPHGRVSTLGVQPETEPAAKGSRRYLLLLAAENWSRVAVPSGDMLSVERASRQPCEVDAWIETDAQNRPRHTPVKERPYYEKSRQFLLELVCPAGVTPDAVARARNKAERPALQDLRLSPETLRALKAAEQARPARPRKDP
jgi:hypothetical protein